MRPKRRERAGLWRDGLQHVPEDQRFGDRQGEQYGIDELLRTGRGGDQHPAAQAAHGQANEGSDAVQYRPATAVGVHDRGTERCGGEAGGETLHDAGGINVAAESAEMNMSMAATLSANAARIAGRRPT
jgi:hypothetical protein